jgi:hypothetical protein
MGRVTERKTRDRCTRQQAVRHCFAVAVARIWPDVYSNAVDPGWVPTRMGGAGALTTSGSGTNPRMACHQ